MDSRIGVIGGGNMARAIIEGSIGARATRPDNWLVAEPDAARRDRFRSAGIRTAESAGAMLDALPAGSQLLLAVKPQVLPDVASEIADRRFEGVAISILAGTPSQRVREALGGSARVIRVMPNTPARICEGMSAIAIGAGAEPGDEDVARALFEAVGEVVAIEEPLMDAFTGVAGSGPAYLFYLAEGMARGAVECGMDAELADLVVRQTLLGAARLLATSDVPASEQREAVTSRGGTTEAALGVLEERNVGESIALAVRAARDRGRELSGD